MSIYTKVPISKPRRNVFNLSHSFKGMINIGELLPIARPIECIPYDTMITGNISQVELAPVVTNFKGTLYFETWQFFVSFDSLWKKGKAILPSDTEKKFSDILVSLSDPQNVLPLPTVSNVGSGLTRIARYLGYFPSYNLVKQLDYYIRGYCQVWNEWFRDENLQNNIAYDTVTTMPLVNYKKDRFTSAFLSTQKGTELRFGTTGDLNIKQVMNFFNGTSDIPVTVGLSDSAGMAPFTSSDSTFTTMASQNLLNRLVGSLDVSLTGITINDLRLYNRLQRWLEKLQLIGSRNKEYLLGSYGIAPNDETLDRPVLLGHTKVPVVVEPIVSNIKQTNQSTIDIQNFQGSRGGVAGASSSFKYGKWLCKEFGFILTLGALRPESSYTDNLPRYLTRTHVVDFYNSIFEHLGQQPVYNYEVSVSGSQSANDLNGVFGYQDIYNELRHLEDFTAPDVVANFPTRNLNRKFNGKQILNSSFISVRPSEYDYLFAVPHSSTVPHAFFTSHNVVKAVRPLSRRSTPRL